MIYTVTKPTWYAYMFTDQWANMLLNLTHDLDCSYQSPAHCSDDEKQEARPPSANAFRKLNNKIFD